jgi:2-polyprenyl-3-methyl-5-hydroxy-6-metoxy-1,4-benzoquinol methylase
VASGLAGVARMAERVTAVAAAALEAPTSVVIDQLHALGITSPQTLLPFHPRVRDRDDISVLRCSASGVIVLSTTAHVTEKKTYEDNASFRYWGPAVETRRQSALKCSEDDRRRAKMVDPLLAGKTWLDIGAGAGGILDIAASRAAAAVAVEPQSAAREAMIADGYTVVPYCKDVPCGEGSVAFDLVTSFHVIEHLLDPVGVLREARERMAAGGTCVVEVPHARDFLLDFLECETFRAFTLWSEHLVLHTRESLKAVMEVGQAALLALLSRRPRRDCIFGAWPDPGGRAQLSGSLGGRFLRRRCPGGAAIPCGESFALAAAWQAGRTPKVEPPVR